MRLADLEPLTEAEQAVIDGLGTGHVTVLGDGRLPGPDAGPDRQVGARLIRWLALGAPGAEALRLHETGLQIMGALVVSDGQVDPALGDESTPGLDLEGCRISHDLLLANCRFQDTPVLRGAKLQTLNLHGAHLPGLRADRLEAQGSVFLRRVEAKGAVRLLGAKIGGDLSCVGGRFENKGGPALSVDGARMTGGFFWRPDEDGNRAYAEGALDLTAAEIGVINDDPACWPKADNLLLNRCRYGAFTGTGTPVSAKERICWLDLQAPARFGDDFWPQPWEHCARVLREMGHPEDARQVLIAKEERQRRVKREIECARLTGARLRKRLEKATTEESVQACFDEAEVALKPFEHEDDPRRKALADELEAASGFQRGTLKKLEERGEAILAQVAAKAERLGTRGADATLAAQSAITDAWTRLAFLRVRDGLLGVLMAYGHRPLRTLGWLAGMWVLGAVLFGIAWGNDGFKPNNAFILRSPEWAGCYEDDTRSAEDKDYRWTDDYSSTLRCFDDQPEADGYPAFNAALYSLDTLVPVVDLEVQDYWVPDETVAGWARGYLWVHISMGWFLALLAVAGFSGLVQTRATSD